MNLRRWISTSARDIAFQVGAFATGGMLCVGAGCDGALTSEPRPPTSSSGNMSSNGGPCGENVTVIAIDRTCAGDASSPADAGVCAEPTAACETVCTRGGVSSQVASCDFSVESVRDTGDQDAATADGSTDASVTSDAGPADGGSTRDVVRCRTTLYCGGRSYDGAPEELAIGAAEGSHVSLGPVFADLAELEWISVTAFERLADALAHHGAPEELVARAETFAQDERRHTALLAELARAHGGTPRLRPPSEPHETTPSLRALAEENASEGCVRETLGALVANVQALRSTCARVREVFEAIADDEARHAELSWDLHAWFLTTLSRDDGARVAASLAAAMASLARTGPPRLSARDCSVFGFGARDHDACVSRVRALAA